MRIPAANETLAEVQRSGIEGQFYVKWNFQEINVFVTIRGHSSKFEEEDFIITGQSNVAGDLKIENKSE